MGWEVGWGGGGGWWGEADSEGIEGEREGREGGLAFESELGSALRVAGDGECVEIGLGGGWRIRDGVPRVLGWGWGELRGWRRPFGEG